MLTGDNNRPASMYEVQVTPHRETMSNSSTSINSIVDRPPLPGKSKSGFFQPQHHQQQQQQQDANTTPIGSAHNYGGSLQNIHSRYIRLLT